MRPTASVSLDLDDLWAYLRTHGEPIGATRPTFLPTAAPRLRAVLAEHRLRATVFVVGADAARDEGAAAVAAFVADGHEIGNHSWNHEPWLHRFSGAELAREIDRTDEAILAAGAPRPTGFRGPGFSVTRELIALLTERGYRYDTSTLPTWIGPVARAHHNRNAGPDAADGAADLFGPVTDALAPVRPFRWADGLVELPVTTMPVLRVPIHGSYLLALHALSPRLARGYFRAALTACRARGVGPTLLLHPTDVLDRREAPGMDFFPGMDVSGADKARLLTWVLATMRARFDVVGTGEHVARLAAAGAIPASTRVPRARTRRGPGSGRHETGAER